MTECQICKSKSLELLFKTKDYRLKTSDKAYSVCRCMQCNAVSYFPKLKDLTSAYPKDYYMPYNPIFDKLNAPVSNKVLKGIIQNIKKFKPRGKALEIGCGTGVFLDKLQKAGFDATGLDISRDSKKNAPESVKSKIIVRTLSKAKFPANSFDIIVLKQVFEHFDRPQEQLEEIHRILKKDGVMYIEVPNFDSIEAKMFGGCWYNLEVPRHIYQYNSTTLNHMLNKHGFIVKKDIKNNGFAWFKSPLAIFHSFFFRLNNEYNVFSSFSKILKPFLIFPLLAFTFILRVLSFKSSGMDLRLIISKGDYKEESLIRRKNANIKIQDIQASFLKTTLRKCKPNTVLEVGSGEGYFTEITSSLAKKVVALDLEDRLAPSILMKRNSIFVKGDGTSIPFKEHTFDVVYSIDVIEHVWDDLKFVKENLRVLKKGGVLLIMTPNKNRLSRKILSYIKRTKYPLNLGTDPALGEIIHVREYNYEEMKKLLSKKNYSYKKIEIKGAFLEILPNYGFKKFPKIFENISKYWIITIVK